MMDDEQVLLRRYAQSRDAVAFRELVDEHKGMVFAACRRVLGNRADAEDAAQDCFLKFSQAAGRLKAPIGGWLHTVAVQGAIDILRSENSRKARECSVASRRIVTSEARWEDVEGELDTALESLSERLRVPIVLYFLEGRTQEDVAAALGMSRRSMARRLDRGIEVLRRRLKRAGIVAPAVALTAMLSANTAEAAPAALTAMLGKIALTGAGGAKAAATGSMMVTLKTVVTVVLAAGAGAGAVAVHHAVKPPRPAPLAAAAAPAPPVKKALPTPEAVLDAELTLNTGVMRMGELATLIWNQTGVSVTYHKRTWWPFMPIMERGKHKVRDVLAAITASAPLMTEVLVDRDRAVICFWQKEPNAEFLADMMKLAVSDDAVERCTAARWLGAVGGRDALLQLLKMVTDPDGRVRYYAANAVVEGWSGKGVREAMESGPTIWVAPDDLLLAIGKAIDTEAWAKTRECMAYIASSATHRPKFYMVTKSSLPREGLFDELAQGGAVARKAAIALIPTRDPRIVPTLIDILATDAKTLHTEATGRNPKSWAVTGLGRIGGPEAEKALMAVVRENGVIRENGTTRRDTQRDTLWIEALYALGVSSSPEAREVLRAALKDPDLRPYAATALGERPDPADLDLLLACAPGLGGTVGESSIWRSVAKIGGKRAAEELVAAATKGSRYAASALARSWDPHCAKAVQKVLAGDDGELRRLMMEECTMYAFPGRDSALGAYYAVDVAVAELSEADGIPKVQHMRLLGWARDPRGTDALTKLLVNAEEQAILRRVAAEKLWFVYHASGLWRRWYTADPAAVESMRHALEHDTNPEVKKLAKKALMRWGVIPRERPAKPAPKDPPDVNDPPDEREFPPPPAP